MATDDYLQLLQQPEPGMGTPAPAAAPANPYLDMLQQDDQAEQLRLRASTSLGVQANPAAVAKQKRAADILGYPLAAVQAQPALEQQAQVQAIDDATRGAPVTRQAFTDADFAKLAHPDAGVLATLESWLKYAVSAPDSQNGGAATDLARSITRNVNKLGAQGNELLGALAVGADKLMGTGDQYQSWWFNHMVDPGLKLAKAQELPKDAPLYRKAVDSVGTLAQMVAAAYATGGAAEAPAVTDGVMTVLANTFTHGAKAMAIPALSDAVGTAQNVYEATGDLNQAMRAGATQYTVSTLGGSLPMAAPGRLATRLGTGFIVGGLQSEASRQAMNLVLPEQLQQRFDPDDIVLSGLIGMGLAGALGPRSEPNLYHAVRQTYVEAARAEAAERGGQALDTISQLAEQTQLREHDPAGFKQLVQRMAEDPDALKAVYANPEAFDKAMQAHGVADADIAQTMPDVARQLAEARVSGADVRIPIEDYATHIAGTPIDQVLRQDLRVDPEGMTFRESQEHFAQQAEQFKQVAQDTLAGKQATDQLRAEINQIRDQVAEQLKATGRFRDDVVRQYAELTKAFYATMAERSGMTPAEFYAAHPLNVTGEALGGPGLSQRTVEVDGVRRPDTNATGQLIHPTFDGQVNFWRWFGDSKVTDAEGKPLVVYHGTGSTNIDAFLPKASSGANVDRSMELVEKFRELQAKNGRMGYVAFRDGSFFSPHPEYANNYAAEGAGVVYPVYIRARNPVYFDQRTKEVTGVDASKTPDALILHDGGKINEVAVLDPAQVKSATGNDGTFDAHDASILSQGTRGTFSPDSNTIALLQHADLSTYLHEMGHFALEVLHSTASVEGAAEGLVKDRDALFKWLGVDPAKWDSMTLDEQRDAHEKFARGFEAYLMEGKAPTAELQGLFSRFRAWLLHVYQSLTRLNVDLTPEVRGVMDRLLASEDAITQAERTRGYFGLDKLPEGVDPKDAAAYAALGKEATEQAISELGARSLRDMKWLSNAVSRKLKELQGEAKKQRAEIREQVAAQFDNSPAMQAKRALADLEREHEAHPFSADMNAQLVAEAHGFQTVEAMHRAINGLGDREQTIDALTDQRMLEEHGELSDPVAIQRAAEAAIHNDARARFMATGLKLLAKSPIPARELQRAARQVAEQLVAEQPIKDLRPQQYSAAEARANKELIKAAPKDHAAAVQHQRSALLNNQLFKVALDAQAQVQKGLDYLKRFDRDSIRQKIDLDVRDQIDDLLDRFDLRKTPPGDERLTREQTNLQNWLDAQRAAGYSPSVSPEAADPRVRMHYADMTVEAFRGLVDSVKALEQVGRERRTITLDGQKVELNDFVATELVPKILERGERFTPEQLLEKPEDRTHNPFALALDHLASWLRAVQAQLKPMEFKRNQYDRHEVLGPFGRAIFEPIMQANYRKVDMLKGLSNDFGAMAEKLGKPWQESLHDSVANDVLVDPDTGKPMNFTRGRMLGMALHVGNESNFDKLTKGWGWKGPDVMRFLRENMTAKDWQAVQAVWDLYEKHWPDTEAMYRRLGQTIPDKIEARPFSITTADGEKVDLKGGYAAITYDALRSRRGEKQAAGESIDPSAGLFGRDYFSRNTPTNGSMNARISGYTDRVSLDYGDVARKLQESIHDLAYRETLIDANKIVEHPDFRKAFRSAYGREAYKSLQDWIGRLANSNNFDRQVGALGKFLQYTRTGMVINAIAFRATTVLKHGGSAGIKTMGYFAGGGKGYLASRMAAMAHDYRNQIETAREKFPEIRARLMQQDRDFRATSHALFEKDSKIAQAERFGHAAVAWSDMMTAVPTAWAAYDWAITEGIPKKLGGTGKPMTEAEAVAFASKVVREAHGSNIEAARSMVLNTDSEALKMFTTLYGFMNTTYGQLADSLDKLHTEGVSKPAIIARTLMAVVVPALWAGFLTHGKPDPSKDESWGGWMAKAIGSEVAATVPFVRDAVGMIEGYKNAGLVSVENWLAAMVTAARSSYQAATNPDSKANVIKDVSNAAGMGLHIPGAGQLGTSLQYLENVREGKEHPEGVGDFMLGLAKGHGSSE